MPYSQSNNNNNNKSQKVKVPPTKTLVYQRLKRQFAAKAVQCLSKLQQRAALRAKGCAMPYKLQLRVYLHCATKAVQCLSKLQLRTRSLCMAGGKGCAMPYKIATMGKGQRAICCVTKAVQCPTKLQRARGVDRATAAYAVTKAVQCLSKLQLGPAGVAPAGPVTKAAQCLSKLQRITSYLYTNGCARDKGRAMPFKIATRTAFAPWRQRG